MPTSDHHNIVSVLSLIQDLQPQSILDVGCGFGKYGVLIREYLDIWNGRYDSAEWEVRLDGIDAFAEYRNPIWDYVYQDIHVGDARQVLPTVGKYDLVLICDVIEHFEKRDAVHLVEECLRHASSVIISTPREFYPQKESHGNEYETHRCLWTAKDFPAGVHVHEIRAMSCSIFVASKTPLPKQKTYLADPNNVLYLRSRIRLRRLGKLAWPVSSGLRALNRLLT